MPRAMFLLALFLPLISGAKLKSGEIPPHTMPTGAYIDSADDKKLVIDNKDVAYYVQGKRLFTLRFGVLDKTGEFPIFDAHQRKIGTGHCMPQKQKCEINAVLPFVLEGGKIDPLKEINVAMTVLYLDNQGEKKKHNITPKVIITEHELANGQRLKGKKGKELSVSFNKPHQEMIRLKTNQDYKKKPSQNRTQAGSH